ncbi:PLP-dependent cysteine synthase family protein [Chondromyces crocatus]|uniref:Cysteine synthase n=1 Tax=Chondromyces crocatus TaxID=52 RepID=A0A0K1EIK6_CHOCO|nr:pyridoxal-phosphate dependent enzyme [Chondromyces crocatus]AKT40690.1 cysteine synthase [Chondromyces crocatus]
MRVEQETPKENIQRERTQSLRGAAEPAPRSADPAPRSADPAPRSADPALRVCDSVLDAIGNTPLIRLSKFIPSPSPQCFVKFEAMNPGGSSKDRSAREMLLAEERTRGLEPGAVVIISTSGNMGIGLAMMCAYKGYRLIAIVDPKISPVNEKILRIYGAKIVKVVERDQHAGYHLTRLKKAEELRNKYPDAIYIDQYDNQWNAEAHYRTTGPEIARALDGKVAAIVIAAGTGGTVMGIARYFKDHYPETHIWAVDEHGSLALPANSIPQPRYLNGMGASQRPANYDYPTLPKYLDKQHYVGAAESIQAALDLARTEGILAGGSGGAVVTVMKNVMRHAYRSDQNVVGILPDHGSRYTADFFDEEWLSIRELPVSLAVDGDEP